MTKSNAPYKKPSFTSLDELSITDDAPPETRARPGGKYSPIFAKLQPNKRLKCPTGTAGRIAQSLREWMKKHSVAGTVKSTEDYKDGAGGVWLIPPAQEERQAKPLRKVA